jgi:ribonuclease D
MSDGGDEGDDAPPPARFGPVSSRTDEGYAYVTSDEELRQHAARLLEHDIVGIDTESDSLFSYTERCCLLQISGDSGPDVVVDPLRLSDLAPLAPLFTDERIVKVFHGADYDVVSIKRDFGFQVRNLFDTMIAAQAVGIERFGLNDLVGQFFSVTLNKKWQRHDWSSRPLLPEHLDYARRDVHYLPQLREILKEMAYARGRGAMLEEEFSLLETREWTGVPFHPDDCLRIKGASQLKADDLRVLRAVAATREDIAKNRNRPPFKVWGNDVCLLLAQRKPKTQAELREVLGAGHHVARRFDREVLDAVRRGLEDRSPPPGASKERPVRGPDAIPPLLREDEPLLTALKNWRNARSQELGLAPGMIVNNGILHDVAALKPKTEAELLRIREMRRWQRDEFGTQLLERVAEWLAAHPPRGEKEQPQRHRRRRRRGRRGGIAP